VILHGFLQPLGDGANLYQQPEALTPALSLLERGRSDDKVGAQGFSLFGNKGLQSGWDRRTLEQMALFKAENVFEDIAHPHRMNGRRGSQAVLVVQPFLIRQAQLRQASAVERVQSLGEGAHQHRQAEERAGNLEQGKPFVVVSGDGHGGSVLHFCDIFVLDVINE